MFVVHQTLEHATRQQAYVFRKKAEQALREKVRHLVGALLLACDAFAGRGAALAQTFCQGGKALGCGFGDVAVGLLGFEALGRGPYAAQQGQVGWLVHLGNAHLCVALGWPVNWVWMRIVSRSDTTRMGGLESARL
ncbi:hypothetical protein EXV95_24485 [Acidovorax sp. JMULE5]|nr:hypothetical protein EXV95_24485 [Acidovorax sp. JMULE5]